MKPRLLLIPILLLAAFFAWRHFSAPKGEREVILAEITAIQKAAQTQNVNGILSRLDKGFKLQGAGKEEIRGQLVAFFFTRGGVKLDLSGLDVKVEDDAATSSGSYVLRWKNAPDAPEESTSGQFQAQWQKIDGQWKITSASGLDKLPQ